jgi:2-methylcitrate dehydratase PrpD
VLSAIEAASLFVQTPGFDASQIERIDLGVPQVIFGRLTSNNPKDTQAAQMSSPFCVALALHLNKTPDQSINIDDFENHIADPVVRALCAKVHCHLDEEVEATSTQESVSAKLKLTLHDKSSSMNFVKAPMGSATRPYTLQNHIDKLNQELSSRMSAHQARMLIDDVLNFHQRQTL